MPTVTYQRPSTRVALHASLCAALVLACSGGQAPTLTPPSLPETTPGPTPTEPGATARPTGTPVAAPWPDGWGIAFCTLFDELVIAQHLARDIGRAFDDDDRDDAAALAHELDATVDNVRQLAGLLPDWSAAAEFESQLEALLEQDERLVTFWLRHLEQGRQQALQNARNVAGELRETYVPDVQTELLALAAEGVECPGQELQLETP